MVETKEIVKIAKKYSLKMILLFGSRANGKGNQYSDFDIAFIAEKELGVNEKISLNTDLISIFECDEIDLVDLRKTDDPILIYEISQNCKLLYGEKEELDKFKIFAFRYYMDHEPLFKLQRAIAEKNQMYLKDIISK